MAFDSVAFDMSRQQLMWFANFAVRKPVMAGCHRLHLWGGDGRSLYNGQEVEVAPVEVYRVPAVAPLGAAARSRGAPLNILDTERPATAIFYGGG